MDDEDEDENCICSVVTAKTKPTFLVRETNDKNEGFLVRESFVWDLFKHEVCAHLFMIPDCSIGRAVRVF